jgi:hypothetical protein
LSRSGCRHCKHEHGSTQAPNGSADAGPNRPGYLHLRLTDSPIGTSLCARHSKAQSQAKGRPTRSGSKRLRRTRSGGWQDGSAGLARANRCKFSSTGTGPSACARMAQRRTQTLATARPLGRSNTRNVPRPRFPADREHSGTKCWGFWHGLTPGDLLLREAQLLREGRIG